jgi:hypothetical protein
LNHVVVIIIIMLNQHLSDHNNNNNNKRKHLFTANHDYVSRFKIPEIDSRRIPVSSFKHNDLNSKFSSESLASVHAVNDSFVAFDAKRLKSTDKSTTQQQQQPGRLSCFSLTKKKPITVNITVDDEGDAKMSITGGMRGKTIPEIIGLEGTTSRREWEQLREANASIQLTKVIDAEHVKIAADGTLFSSRLEFFREVYQDAYKLAIKNKTIRSRKDVSTDWARDLGHSGGDVRYRKMQELLNNMGNGLVRSEDQVVFHNGFTTAVLPHVYGDDWEANCVRVMEELKIDKIDYEVMVMSPRRWGKTYSIAMFVLALALSVPGIRICIFSTGSRASGSLVNIMKMFMKNIPGAEARICKSSAEELYIAIAPCGGPQSSAAKSAQNARTTSVIMSFPSSVKGEFII